MNTVEGARRASRVPFSAIATPSSRITTTSIFRWKACSQISLLLCSILTAGCSALQSQAVGSHTPDGIPYFLPRRPFVITVSTPSAGGLPSITVGPGTAEPDLRKEFVLSQGINVLAQNEFNIGVASNGLLQSGQSNATSQIAAVIQNAAASAGMFAAPLGGAIAASPQMKLLEAPLTNVPESPPLADLSAPLPDGPKVGCPLAGTSYQYLVYPEFRFNSAHPLTFVCPDSHHTAFTVAWSNSDPKPLPSRSSNSTADKKWKVSGIFFRHELPYLVVITGHQDGEPDTKSHFIVSSPDESETDFFHVTRNFFANNTANISLTDGVITGIDQVTQSEAAGLVGLPATFISSYTTAVGQLFSGLTSISSGQQKLLQQMQSTAATQNQAAAVAAAQYQSCRKTVASFNFANMSDAQANAAAAAIQAACASGNSTGTTGSAGN